MRDYLPTKRGFVLGVALWAAVAAQGCSSATRDISRAATQAAASAQSADNHFTAIAVDAAQAETMTPDDSPVAPLLDNIKAHAAAGLVDTANVKVVASDIHTALPGVVDVVPWWATLLGRIAIAVVFVVVCVFIYTSGLFPAIRAFLVGFKLFAWLIPRPTSIRAKFDVENIESGEASAARKEVVAASRSADPVYDKVYQNKQQELRLNKMKARVP